MARPYGDALAQSFGRQFRMLARRHLYKESQEERRHRIEDWRLCRVQVRRRRTGGSDESRIVPQLPCRSGPMARWELYRWHRENGTLALFWAMYGPG